MDSTRDCRLSLSDILRTQSLLMAACRSAMKLTCVSFSWVFIQAQQFVIGLRSGLLPGQSIRVIRALTLSLKTGPRGKLPTAWSGRSAVDGLLVIRAAIISKFK